MPYSVRYEPKLKRGKQYTIVEQLRSGRTVVRGHSGTRERAEASVKARRAAEHGWKPSRRSGSKK